MHAKPYSVKCADRRRGSGEAAAVTGPATLVGGSWDLRVGRGQSAPGRAGVRSCVTEFPPWSVYAPRQSGGVSKIY